MIRRQTQTMDGETIVELIPETEEDLAELERLAQEGVLARDEGLHSGDEEPQPQ